MLATSAPVVITSPLGPDPKLADALLRRLTEIEIGLRTGDAIVIAAAGSTDPRALADIEQVASWVRKRRSAPVETAYVSGGVGLDATIRSLTAAGHRVVVGTYLICPGKLADTVAKQAWGAGAVGVSAPLGVCAELLDLIHDRWTGAQSA